MPQRRPRKAPPSPSVVADTCVTDPAADHPAYADITVPVTGTPGDPRALQVHRDQPPHPPPAAGPRDVPYLPTDQHVVNKMMEMARVTRADTLYDLGCGDGRICITAAKLGARAVGVEIDLQRLRECHDNLRNTQLKHLVEFRRQSFFDVDLRPATVVAIYLLPAINRLLRPKMLFELRPGSRIIANYFEVADWVPDEQIVFKHRPVMLWIVPAWVQGTYRCVLRLGQSDAASPETRTTHMNLTLARRFQVLTGTARFGKRTLPLTGRIRGTQVEIDLPELPGHRAPARITSMYEANAHRDTRPTLRGSIKSGPLSGLFAGLRQEGPGHHV